MLEKPEPRKREKARRKRAEAKTIKTVRAEVVARDGYCRLQVRGLDARETIAAIFGPCRGASEWAHLGEKKRFKTRGQTPEDRHQSAHTCMLCDAHHDAYDANRIRISYRTAQGANGAMLFECEEGSYAELEEASA